MSLSSCWSETKKWPKMSKNSPEGVYRLRMATFGVRRKKKKKKK